MSKSKPSSKVSYPASTLTVDTGWNTGWAFWRGTNRPVTGIIRITGEARVARDCERLGIMYAEFSALVKLMRPKKIYLEAVEKYQTMAGQAAADSGDLFKLAYLIGGYIRVGQLGGAGVTLLTAPEWKGNMSKEITGRRVELATGLKYPNHICDAVGMGLHLAGCL